MEWEPNERDAWVHDAQRWIAQIKGVLQCKIDLDEQGEIAGVHVVAGMDRDPRLIVRDVESLLKARLQMDVYYKKIGVVQVVDGPRPPAGPPGSGAPEPPMDPSALGSTMPPATGVTFLPPRAGTTPLTAAAVPATPAEPPAPAVLVAQDAFPRPICRGVSLLSSDHSVRAEVVLAAGGREAAGAAEAAGHADADLLCIARATLEAAGLLLALPVLLHLREARLDTVGGQATVLAAVDLVESRRTETLLGACALRHNRQQAVVHAVLDALNRRLGLYAVREDEATA
ncbi:hypothetical protein FJ250_01270 [bacterium]|nr:hypothetical protein [bacterium]